MPKKHNHLFEQIASFRTLHEAAKRAICGKRSKPGAAAYMANLEKNLLRTEQMLKEGTWRGSLTARLSGARFAAALGTTNRRTRARRTVTGTSRRTGTTTTVSVWPVCPQ